MRTSVRSLSVVLVAVLALGVATACTPKPIAKVSGTVDVRCSFTTKSVPVDWYFPAGTPKGLVWLQHGFTESKSDWDEFARKAADQGMLAMATTLPSADLLGCTVQNLGNNTAFLNNVAALFDGLGDPNSALGRSHAAAAAQAGRAGQALPQKLTFSGHSAGGEAVLYVADRLRTDHPATFAKLGGLVLQDPVKSFSGNSTGASLDGLAGTTLPIYALAAPKGSCNADQSGTTLVVERLASRPFHGAQITTGTHGDIFGSSLNSLGEATCGTPKPTDTSAAQLLTLLWLNDQFAGTTNPAGYPGGSLYDALVANGTITTLP